MKLLLIILCLVLSLSISAQDVVYDSLRGDRSNFRRIKWGTSEAVYSTWYENQGVICRSKVLLAGRVWDGLVRPDDFQIIYFPFPTDIVKFEFKTSGPTNLIIYKYPGPVDTLYYAGLRKAELGSDIFTGQYLFVHPINKNCSVKIYDGIGTNKTLVVTLTDGQITDADCREYVMSDQVTFETLNGTTVLLLPTTKQFISIDSIKANINIWPNPVSYLLNLSYKDNPGVMVRLYDVKAALQYEERMIDELILIDVANIKPGLYLLVITDYNKGNIIKTFKVIIL